MMIIPQQNAISTDVPGADLNPNQQGMPEAALAETIGRGLTAGMNVYGHMVKAEAEEALNKKMSEITIKSDMKRKELEMQSEGGYMLDEKGNRTQRTMTEAFRDWANDEYHAGQASMPNQLGQDLFREHGMSSFTQEIGLVHATEWAKRAEFFKTQREQRKDDEGHFLQNNADLGTMNTYLEKWAIDTKGSVKNGSISANEVDHEIRSGWNNLASKTVEGMLDNIEMGVVPDSVPTGFINHATGEAVRAPKGQIGAIDDLIDILEEKQNNDPTTAGLNPNVWDPEDTISERKAKGMPTLPVALTPEKKDEFLHRLLVMRRQLQKKEGNDFEERIRGLKGAIEIGQPLDPKDLESAMSVGLRMTKDHPEEKLRVTRGVSEVIAAKYVASVLPLYKQDPASFKTLPTETQKAVLERAKRNMAREVEMVGQRFGVSPNDMNIAGRSAIAEFDDKLKQEMASNASAFEKDPSSYLASQSKPLKFLFANKVTADNVAALGPKDRAQLQGALSNINHSIQDYAQHGQITEKPGLPNFNHFEDNVAAKLNNVKIGPAQGVQYFNGLKESLGPHFPDALDSMIERKKIRPEFRLVALLGDRMRQQRVYDLLAREGSKQDVNEQFMAKFPKDTNAEGDLRNSLAELTNEKLSFMYRNDPQGDVRTKVTQVQEAMILFAKDQMNQDPNLDPSKAAKAASEFFLGDKKISKVNTGFMGMGGNRIVYPSTLNDGTQLSDNQLEQFNSYIQRSFTKDQMKKIPWELPKDLGGVEREKFIEHMFDNLPDNSIRFGNNPNNDRKMDKYGPEQGWWITIPGYSNKSKLIDIPARVKTPDGKSKIFFIPAKQALSDQHGYDMAEKQRATQQKAKDEQQMLKKGIWGGDRQ
jgi:hypothetical protein